MFVRITSLFFTACLALFFCVAAGFGQDLDDVTISGRLADSNGLAVVGAKVTATETITGVERTAVSDDDGRYRFIKLKPGTYKVKATATGFGSTAKAGLKFFF